MTTHPAEQTRIRLRALRPGDLPSLIRFWNLAFQDRRGFLPMSEALLRERVLDCPAFDARGLILAWHRDADGESIVGLVHAFRPPPDTAVYRRWGRHHTIAVLYVDPATRRQGVGTRLLRAAEDWLYYCPVHFAGQSVPCYGNAEGPQPPLFGSAQRMGVNAREQELLHFLSKRGYAVTDPGDVSMHAEIRGRAAPERLDVSAFGLRLLRVDNAAPFQGVEPPERQEYTSWAHGYAKPYAAILLTEGELLRGHICWYPLHTDRATQRTAAIYGYWLAPSLRGNGLGSLLLDTALADMASYQAMGGPFDRVEVQTHLVRHSDAVALYESRGFTIDDAWVTLVKT